MTDKMASIIFIAVFLYEIVSIIIFVQAAQEWEKTGSKFWYWVFYFFFLPPPFGLFIGFLMSHKDGRKR